MAMLAAIVRAVPPKGDFAILAHNESAALAFCAAPGDSAFHPDPLQFRRSRLLQLLDGFVD